MNPFSPNYTPVIKTSEVKANKRPAPANVFDNGTPAERMQRNAQTLPVTHKTMSLRPSTM